MRAEEQLLLDLTRAFVAARGGERAAPIRETPVDEERFLELGERHHLAPILYFLSTSGAWKNVPSRICDRLRKAAMDGAMANAILEREALRVVSRLGDEGIVALVYKGLVLGASAYGDTSLRPHQDLDLMLREADLDRASQVLRGLGYEPEPELAGATATASRHWCELNFDKDIAEGLGGKFHVELHWRVLPGFTAIAGDGDAMVPRRKTLTISGVEVFTPDPADHLIALALHGAKHRWDELRLVLDVALLVSSLSDGDVQALHDRARGWRVRRMVALALTLAERIGARPIGKLEVDVEGLVREVEEVLFSDRQRTALHHSLFLLRCLDGWRDVGRYFVAHGRSEVDRHEGLGGALSYAVGRAVDLLRA